MKKIAISLIALAALSGATFASGNRNNELREQDTYMGQYPRPHISAGGQIVGDQSDAAISGELNTAAPFAAPDFSGQFDGNFSGPIVSPLYPSHPANHAQDENTGRNTR